LFDSGDLDCLAAEIERLHFRDGLEYRGRKSQ
jgi:hypothetical protein